MSTIRNLRWMVALVALIACTKGGDTRAQSDTAAPPAPPPPLPALDSGAMLAPVVRMPDGAAPAPSSPARQGSKAPRTPAARTPAVPREPSGPVARQGTPGQSDIARLEMEARALAKSAGCENSGQCRTAPVGSRACGGPRLYLAYCSLTTDSAALFRKLKELERAEQAYNMEQGMASTCEMRMPPDVSLVGGSCRAVQSSPPGPERMP